MKAQQLRVEELVRGIEKVEWFNPKKRASIEESIDSVDSNVLSMEVYLPSYPANLFRIGEQLAAVDKRIQLALWEAFAEEGSDFEVLRKTFFISRLLTGRPFHYRVRSIELSSVKIKIEIDGEDAARILKIGKPPRKWKSRFIKALSVVFGATILSVAIAGADPANTTLKPPSVSEVIQTTCGKVPNGTELTLHAGPLDIKYTCQAPNKEQPKHKK